jgi:hypothetical protein
VIVAVESKWLVISYVAQFEKGQLGKEGATEEGKGGKGEGGWN